MKTVSLLSIAAAAIAANVSVANIRITEVMSSSNGGVSLSSAGDGVVLFNSGNTEVTRVSFGAATSGSTFFRGYDAASGVVDSSYSGLVSTVGTIGSQVTFQSSGDTGSLGTAINAPAPGAVALLGVAGLLNGRRRR
jgi:hypothetical protein